MANYYDMSAGTSDSTSAPPPPPTTNAPSSPPPPSRPLFKLKFAAADGLPPFHFPDKSTASSHAPVPSVPSGKLEESGAMEHGSAAGSGSGLATAVVGVATTGNSQAGLSQSGQEERAGAVMVEGLGGVEGYAQGHGHGPSNSFPSARPAAPVPEAAGTVISSSNPTTTTASTAISPPFGSPDNSNSNYAAIAALQAASSPAVFSAAVISPLKPNSSPHAPPPPLPIISATTVTVPAASHQSDTLNEGLSVVVAEPLASMPIADESMPFQAAVVSDSTHAVLSEPPAQTDASSSREAAQVETGSTESSSPRPLAETDAHAEREDVEMIEEAVEPSRATEDPEVKREVVASSLHDATATGTATEECIGASPSTSAVESFVPTATAATTTISTVEPAKPSGPVPASELRSLELTYTPLDLPISYFRTLVDDTPDPPEEDYAYYATDEELAARKAAEEAQRERDLAAKRARAKRNSLAYMNKGKAREEFIAVPVLGMGGNGSGNGGGGGGGGDGASDTSSTSSGPRRMKGNNPWSVAPMPLPPVMPSKGQGKGKGKQSNKAGAEKGGHNAARTGVSSSILGGIGTKRGREAIDSPAGTSSASKGKRVELGATKEDAFSFAGGLVARRAAVKAALKERKKAESLAAKAAKGASGVSRRGGKSSVTPAVRPVSLSIALTIPPPRDSTAFIPDPPAYPVLMTHPSYLDLLALPPCILAPSIAPVRSFIGSERFYDRSEGASPATPGAGRKKRKPNA